MTMPDYGAPTTLDHLLEAFEFLEDWEDRYRFILDLGRKLPEMPESEKTEVNFVHGCQSQVWVALHETGGAGSPINCTPTVRVHRQGPCGHGGHDACRSQPSDIGYDIESVFDPWSA